MAQTPSQQARGLMYRRSLPSAKGVLFPVQPPRPVKFWIKNLEMPLDVVFVRDGQAIAIAHRVPACQANPCPLYETDIMVDSVVELSAGEASSLGLFIGKPLVIQPLPSREV
ncbi:DUF192 domain-containing protein [Trichocoleus sp. FACHB-90]|uniref:DUF192 domain-containing protein n=1 Tax=Cyanophyceae TaxID=3028117 RepID=UPI001682B7D7|nr:DUF192 domain-containing protein [Trichocoleus sp. FACHB-90]MBD1930074.1 DUF192 domain-containing protein [Trichocoleus sp. FACHB-90]